jgi:ribosomal-protein-alanine N-acetyltransferase
MPDAVRMLRDDEAATAAGLYAACFDAPWERPWSAAEFAHLMRTPGCIALILIVDDRPSGLALARVAADEAELLTLGVAPPARRRGGGARLLSTLVGKCRCRGARSLFLEVAEDNMPAHRLYETHGFVVVARRPGYFPRGTRAPVTALVMRLELPA